MVGRKFHAEAISPDWRTANVGVLEPRLKELRFGGLRSPAFHLRAPRGADVPLRSSHQGRGHARNPVRSRFRTPWSPRRHDLVALRPATQCRWLEHSFVRSLLLARLWSRFLLLVACVRNAPAGGMARKAIRVENGTPRDHADVAGAPYNAARCNVNHPDRFMDARPNSGRLALWSRERARVNGHRLRHRYRSPLTASRAHPAGRASDRLRTTSVVVQASIGYARSAQDSQTVRTRWRARSFGAHLDATEQPLWPCPDDRQVDIFCTTTTLGST